MCSLAPPRNTKMATTARRNVVERSNENSIVRLIKTLKLPTNNPDLNPTGSLQFAFQNKISAQILALYNFYLLRGHLSFRLQTLIDDKGETADEKF